MKTLTCASSNPCQTAHPPSSPSSAPNQVCEAILSLITFLLPRSSPLRPSEMDPGFVQAPLSHHRLRPAQSLRDSKFVCSRRHQVRMPPSRSSSQLSMGLFGLGFPELAVIAGVGIFIFGPSKLAEMGKDLGGLAGGVKKATSEFREAMQESLDEADRELEQKKIEKEGNVDASASVVEKQPGGTEG